MIAWIDATREISSFRMWSLTSLERNLRQLREVGCREAVIYYAKQVKISNVRGLVIRVVVGSADRQASAFCEHALNDEPVVVVRAEMVYDTRILSTLKESGGESTVFYDERGEISAAWLNPGTISGEKNWESQLQSIPRRLMSKDIPGYIPSLRVTVTPEAILINSKENARRAENLFFQSAIKGVMDILYTYVYLRIVAWLMRVISVIRLNPNQITIAYLFISVGAVAAYANAEFGWGLFLSACTMICDAWDGVLARLTFQSSKLGHRLDKVSHSIYHPLWYFAIAYSLFHQDTDVIHIANAVLLTLLFFVMKPITIAYNRRFNRSLYDNTAFDRGFRLITGTRWNMNMIILSAGYAFEYFEESFYFITVYGAASVAYWLERFIMAFAKKTRG
jgi:phosphatidylglycerophosphate synthase